MKKTLWMFTETSKSLELIAIEYSANVLPDTLRGLLTIIEWPERLPR
jgi:hypothetical protein